MEIRACARAEYPQMLEMLNRAFDCKDAAWFERNVSMCVPYEHLATDAQIARHVIALEGGAVLGCVGAYPFELTLCADAPGGAVRTAQAFGIGQVACAAAARGRGVMSALLKAAINGAVAEGAAIGFLVGDRHRYGHFGFDLAGGKVCFDLDMKRFTEAAPARRMTEADIPRLSELHGLFPTRVTRGAAYWARLLARENYAGYIAEDGAAYLFAKLPDGDITELQGDPAAAMRLLKQYASETGRDGLTVEYPQIPRRQDPLYAALYAACVDFAARPACLAYRAPGTTLSPAAPDETFWIPEIDNI